MLKKVFIIGICLFMIMIILTGCSKEEKMMNIQNEDSTVENKEKNDLPYTWIIEPKIEADDIIDLEFRKEVSLIKKGKKYNFINNDQGKELLREDFFGYATFDNSDIYIWKEGGPTLKVYEDYMLEEVEYAGDFATEVVYYNKERQELFTQNHTYLVVNNDNSEIIANHKKIHGTVLESFTEVMPTDFIDDEFDKYAEFTEVDLEKSGYYNKETLEIVIEPIYEKAYNFYEGYAAVKKDGKAGFIDMDGKEIFEFEFEETRGFDQGRAWVKVDGKWGVIELKK